MAQRITVTIPGPGPWGFRLAGGRDFNQPLYISKVTPGSKAHRASILENDNILSINGRDVRNMTHLEAQNFIKSLTGNLSFNLERSSQATIWTPEIQQQQDAGFNVSLKANKQDFQHAGSSHNVKPRLFPGAGAGSGTTSTVSHNQFNSPMGVYSAQNAAESYRGQTEGIDDGQPPAWEKPSAYGPGSKIGTQSRSFRMVQQLAQDDERDFGPATQSPPPPQPAAPQPAATQPAAPQQDPAYRPSGTRSVKAPVAKPTTGGAKPANALPVCHKCNRNIMGPFVKVRGNPLHDTCFTCESCALSLRNKGFFVINEKLYCEACKNRIQQHQSGQVNGGSTRSTTTVTTQQVGNKSPSQVAGRKTYSTTTVIHPTSAKGDDDMAAPPPPPPPPPGASNYAWRASTPPAPRPSAPQSSFRPGGPPPAPKGQPPRAVLPGPPPNFGQRGPSPTPRGPSTAPRPSPMAQAPPPRGPGPAAQRPGGPPSPIPARPGVAPAAASRTPYCDGCNEPVRGTFVEAFGRNWHPEHFVCAHCHENLQGKGVIEDKSKIYCEDDYMRLYAPKCSKCMKSITGECVKAMGSEYHPGCFTCVICNLPITGDGFHMQDGLTYCKRDFQNKFRGVNCGGCNFPIEAGEAWLEALDKSYHAECFTCAHCNQRLEGQRFYARGGLPYCQAHGS